MSLQLRNWKDEGLDVRLYVSTSGDFISIGERSYYPFESGGPNGVPLGWTVYDTAGYPVTDVNRSVGLGRFNISCAGGAAFHPGGVYYGAYRDFPMAPDTRVIIQTQVRTIDGRTSANHNINASTQPGGSGWGSVWLTQSDWDDVSLTSNYAAAGTTGFRLVLQAQAPPGSAETWGIQFQGLSFLTQPKVVPTPTWHEVTCDTKALETRHGRDKYTARYDVATATISINNDDGEFTYKDAQEWGLRPGRFIKVETTRPGSGTIYGMFYGIIDSLTDGYTLDGHVSTVINCVDVSSLLSNVNVPSLAGSVNTRWLSGDRWKQQLDSVGWHNAMSAYDHGQFSLQNAHSNGRSMRDELGLITDSEGSYWWADRKGILQYYDRSRRGFGSSALTTWKQVQAELLAVPYHDGDILPPVDAIADSSTKTIVCVNSLTVDWSRDRIMNTVQLANQGYSSYTYIDDASMKKYGPHTYQRMDLLNDNSDKTLLDTRADDLMTGYTESVLRVNSVSFVVTPDMYRWALSVFMNDLVRVRYENSREGWGYSVVTRIQSLLHVVKTDIWTCTLVLDEPVPGTFNFWQTSDTGWDIAFWDIDLWDEFGTESAYWSSGEKWGPGSDPVAIWGDSGT